MEFEKAIDNECAFQLGDDAKVCSPTEILEKLNELVVQFTKTRCKNDICIIESLKKKYNCASESCVLVQSDIKNHLEPHHVKQILKERFRAVGPRNSTAWLSNFDIDDCLKQIEQKYNDQHFLHIPYQMIDFEKMGTELDKLDWPAKYNEGYRCFGTVVNVDYSTGQGIHWFAIFGDFRGDKWTIEYFNSSGERPMDEITMWLKKVKLLWSKAMNHDIFDIMVSNIQMQRDSHSCGVYSLYYIISRISDIPWTYFRDNRVPDEVMHKFRNYLFRDEL